MAKHNNKNPKCNCGQDDPAKFSGDNKSTCYECVKKRQNAKNKRNREMYGAPTMSQEEQTKYANTPIKSGRVAELRGFYG